MSELPLAMLKREVSVVIIEVELVRYIEHIIFRLTTIPLTQSMIVAANKLVDNVIYLVPSLLTITEFLLW